MKTETKWVVGIAAIVILGFGALMWSSSNSRSNGGDTGTPADPAILVREDSRTTGTTSAAVTVVEFGDYQCPACAAIDPLVEAALAKYEGQMTFVFRNFPLPQHTHAVLAAQAAEAAGDQGKFWEMHHLLYEKQDGWADASDPQATFVSYAQELGLNTETFTATLEAETYEDKINRDKADGNKLGVAQTPTFFVNGKLLLIRSNNDLDAAIAAAVAQ